MVDHPITIGGGTDLSLLAFVDEETAVGSRPIGVGGQFLVQLPQGAFLGEEKGGHSGAKVFALASLLGGTEQCLVS
jgi:hypothetical protein